MTRLEKLRKMNAYLLDEAPEYRSQAAAFGRDEKSQFRLFRSLVNVRMPKAANEEFLALQDEFLQAETAARGVTRLSDLTPVCKDIYLWRGDITALAADAVVNAANSRLLGCFCPCHGCIDNAIHTFAGIRLRQACNELMEKQGGNEPTGRARITPAFNLPSRYVLHTVGPIVSGSPSENDCAQLSSCYRSCLALAGQYGCESIAFCCISTGEFCFPNYRAAELALRTVFDYKKETASKIKVIFNVFKEYDYEIYRDLLGKYREAQK